MHAFSFVYSDALLIPFFHGIIFIIILGLMKVIFLRGISLTVRCLWSYVKIFNMINDFNISNGSVFARSTFKL